MRYRMTAVDRKFNRKVHEAAMKDGGYVIPIEGMRFFRRSIGEGTFAILYLGEDNEGRRIVLKKFERNDYRESKTEKAIEYKKVKLRERKEILMQDPFARLVEVFPEGNNFGFVAEYFDGITIDDCLESTKYPRKREKFVDLEDRDIQARIFSTYVQMLKVLHSQGLVYYDNSWRNVMVSSDEVKIIDPDSIKSLDELNRKEGPEIAVGYVNEFASLAQVTRQDYSESVDLEGVALMIDYFYWGSAFFNMFGDVVYVVQQQERDYTLNRSRLIPSKLREFVVQVISKPLEHGMTLSDLESAVNLEFGL